MVGLASFTLIVYDMFVYFVYVYVYVLLPIVFV